jgi:hypothetical protein
MLVGLGAARPWGCASPPRAGSGAWSPPSPLGNLQVLADGLAPRSCPRSLSGRRPRRARGGVRPGGRPRLVAPATPPPPPAGGLPMAALGSWRSGPRLLWTVAGPAAPPSALTVPFFEWQGDSALVRSPGWPPYSSTAVPGPRSVATKLAALASGASTWWWPPTSTPTKSPGSRPCRPFAVAWWWTPGRGSDRPTHRVLRPFGPRGFPSSIPRPGAVSRRPTFACRPRAEHCAKAPSPTRTTTPHHRLTGREAQSVLFTGDAPADRAAGGPARRRPPALAVVSKCRTTAGPVRAAFLAAVHARVAVVAWASRTASGHPKPELLAELRRDGCGCSAPTISANVTVVFRKEACS